MHRTELLKTENESTEPFIANLFDWTASTLVSVKLLRVLYLLILILTTITVGLVEFYIARYLEGAIVLKLVYGILALLAGLIFVIISRLVYELYFAFFYMERYLREINLRILSLDSPRESEH